MSSRKLQPKPGVMDIEIYVPGKSAAPAGVRLHKLSSNETPLGSSPAAQEAIAALARNKGEIRHRVGKAVTIKHTPDLRFLIDETFDRMDETRRILSEPRVRADIEHDAGDEEE